MPYVSRAQAGYFHTHKAQLEREGVNVDEWDAATKGKHLPERASMKSEHVDLGKKGSFSVKKGALHGMLGIPEDQKIPASKLTPHAGDSPLLRRRKASAKGFRSMKHG
jgi:hypothetical protein